MKNIYILPDKRDCWREIEKRLRDVNANIVRIHPDFDLAELKKTPPSLFIVGEEVGESLLTYKLRNYVMMIVKEDGSPGAIRPSERNKKWVSIVWPLSSEEFTRLSGELIQLAERREFRTVLRIRVPGEEVPQMGQSLDFSLSGMSFKTQSLLELNAQVEISLTLPDVNGSLLVPIEIVRSVPEGKWITYGARFSAVASSTMEHLKKFVLPS